MEQIAQYLPQNLNVNLANISFSPSYLQAGLIVVLLFILLLTMAQVRRHLLTWSLKGALFGIFLGFLLVLFLEGFLVIGGKTAITEVLGWKNAPQPILGFIEVGRSRMAEVLGVKTQIPLSNAKEQGTIEGLIDYFQSLNPSQQSKIKTIICAP